jgi:hypothetical protein
MTGILEAIHADLQIIKGLLNGGATGAGQQAPAQPPQTQLQQPVDPFAAAPAAPAQPAQVTEAQVMSLIEPHLDNAALKGQLSQVLSQMGIARLPEARPDQLPELYTRFSQVIQQFATQPAPAQPQGII